MARLPNVDWSPKVFIPWEIHQGVVEVLIHFDGAVAPINPGGTGAWAFVAWDQGQISSANWNGTRHGFGIFPAAPGVSSNLMEYEALARALESVREAKSVAVRGDSKLVIEQMSGRWRVGGGLYREAHDRALVQDRRLRLLGAKIEYMWVPREQNKSADALTKSALRTAGAFPRSGKSRHK